MTWLIVVLALVVVLAAVAAYRWNQSAALRRRFGPEYERILALEGGDQRRAGAALRERTRRRAALSVRDLDAAAHTRYGERWYAVQGHFVDDPRAAVDEAAGLVRSVMRDRGYEAEDPALADGPDATAYDELDFVAVDHPEAATRFRAAQDVERSAGASTEDLRLAFQGYKALFQAVLVVHEDAGATVADDAGPGADGSARTGIHRVLDLRRRSDDGEDHEDGEDRDSDGDGDGALGGFLARLRRQPAGHDSR